MELDPRNYRVNFSKVKEIMHFEPSFSVEDGIQELIFALSNHLFDSVEVVIETILAIIS